MLSEEGGLKDLKQDIPFIFDEKNELGTLFGVYDENCKEEYNAYIGIGLHGDVSLIEKKQQPIVALTFKGLHVVILGPMESIY